MPSFSSRKILRRALNCDHCGTLVICRGALGRSAVTFAKPRTGHQAVHTQSVSLLPYPFYHLAITVIARPAAPQTSEERVLAETAPWQQTICATASGSWDRHKICCAKDPPRTQATAPIYDPLGFPCYCHRKREPTFPPAGSAVFPLINRHELRCLAHAHQPPRSAALYCLAINGSRTALSVGADMAVLYRHHCILCLHPPIILG